MRHDHCGIEGCSEIAERTLKIESHRDGDRWSFPLHSSARQVRVCAWHVTYGLTALAERVASESLAIGGKGSQRFPKQ